MNMAMIQSPNFWLTYTPKVLSSTAQIHNYFDVEQQFLQLLKIEDLDQQVAIHPELANSLQAKVESALQVAYAEPYQGRETVSAHLLLQRILYYINRLNLFWYDDLQHYKNERSLYLQWFRDRIEVAWQAWEIGQIDVARLKTLRGEQVKQVLQARSQRDLDPPLTPYKWYLREEMSIAGYRLLLAIASLEGV
jgi:hypothetical protein